MTNSCCFHSCGQMPLSHIFMHGMCKTFTVVGPIALTSSADRFSKPGALPECRSLITLSTSDSNCDGSLFPTFTSIVCLLFSSFWKSYSPYSYHLPRISVGLVSLMPVFLFIAICLEEKVLFFTFLLGQTAFLTSWLCHIHQSFHSFSAFWSTQSKLQLVV